MNYLEVIADQLRERKRLCFMKHGALCVIDDIDTPFTIRTDGQKLTIKVMSEPGTNLHKEINLADPEALTQLWEFLDSVSGYGSSEFQRLHAILDAIEGAE